jgi:hypothetical protein
MINFEEHDQTTTIIVYEPQSGISFFRPLFGTELTMSQEEISQRIRHRCKTKWRHKVAPSP